MLGLKRGTVKLTKAHSEWERLYELEKHLLQDTLGDKIVAIEHVGSTAIPGVPAKPIIDIRLASASVDDAYIEKNFVQKLTALGYHYMHKYPDRHFFAKGPESCRTHHVSIVKSGDANEWNNTILFRDYLRTHDDARDEYAKLKTLLAEKFADDRASYTKAKEDFIKRVIDEAKISEP